MSKARFINSDKGDAYVSLGQTTLLWSKKLSRDLKSLIDDSSLSQVSTNSSVRTLPTSLNDVDNLSMSLVDVRTRGHLFHMTAAMPVA